MRTRPIGSLQVSVVGLGCNNLGGRLDETASRAVVRAALDAGITLFDTADIYSDGRSEQILGEALRGVRDEVVIATKFGHAMGKVEENRGGSRAAITRSVEASLRRLGTDRIDLYQQHMPDDTPVEETLETLDELVRAGKVLEIGSSNYGVDRIRSAERVAREHGWARFTGAQNHFNLLAREVEEEVLPACVELGIGMLPYFPLASGMLTGKYRRGQEPAPGTRLAGIAEERRARLFSDRAFDAAEGLERFAHARGRETVVASIAWLLAKPAVASVIAGASDPDQVVTNVSAAGWDMTDAEVREIDALA